MGATRLNLEENLRRSYDKIYSTFLELKEGDMGLFWNSSLDSLMQAVISKIGKIISSNKTEDNYNNRYDRYSTAGNFERAFEFMPCLQIAEDGELILAKKDIFYRDNSFSSIITKAGKTIEFLYIKPDGVATLTLQYFSEGSKVNTHVCSYGEQKEFFLFNLPFFEYSIINNDGEEKDKLVKIVKDNPTSTVAKIYDFITKNKDIVSKIEKLFQDAEEQYNVEGKTKRDIGSCSGSISGAMDSFGQNLNNKKGSRWGRNSWNYELEKVENKLIFTNKDCFYYSKPQGSQNYYNAGIDLYDYNAFFQPISFEVKGDGVSDIKYVKPSFSYVIPAKGSPKTFGYEIISEEDFIAYVNKNFEKMFQNAAKYAVEQLNSGNVNVYSVDKQRYVNALIFDSKSNTVKAVKGSTFDVVKLNLSEKKVEVLFSLPARVNGNNYTDSEITSEEFIKLLREKIPFDFNVKINQDDIVESLKKNIVNANARFRNANSSLEKVRQLYTPLEEITNFIVSAYRSEIFVTML